MSEAPSAGRPAVAGRAMEIPKARNTTKALVPKTVSRRRIFTSTPDSFGSQLPMRPQQPMGRMPYILPKQTAARPKDEWPLGTTRFDSLVEAVPSRAVRDGTRIFAVSPEPQRLNSVFRFEVRIRKASKNLKTF